MRNAALIVALSCSSLLLVPTGAGAAPRADRDREPPMLRIGRSSPAIERVTILRPSPESEATKVFLVLALDDGSRGIVSQPLRPQAESSATSGQSVMWTIDLSRGTYTLRETEPSERDLAFVEEVRRRWGAVPGDRDVHAEWEDWGEEAEAGYAYMHAAETWEPAAYIGFAPLNRTEVEIAWSECGTTFPRLYLDGFLPRCWANPSTLGIGLTSWSTLSCQPDHPGSSSEWGLSGGVAGTYINWDWNDPNEPTFSYHDVSINAEFGGDGWGWVYQQEWGENARLLSGKEFAGTVWPRLASCKYRGGGSGGGGGDPGDPSDPGDPGDPGGPGGGSTWNCVPVSDGETGEYLGDCCGFTAEQIIDCAAEYLAAE